MSFKYNNLTPFKWCMIQNFPFIEADFDAITNYQLYCKVVEYLNKIRDNTNILGLKVEEFAHYFENLNVQEEVNNKLDEMAENGILQEIMASYLNTKAIFGFNNVEEMKNAENLIDGSFARTLGYYKINDKGNALYKIRNRTIDDIIDNGKIILMNNENLVAELIIKSYVTPEMFGAKGDGIEDDTNAIKNTLKFKNVVLTKNYLITDSLELHQINFKCTGTIKNTNIEKPAIKICDSYANVFINYLESENIGIEIEPNNEFNMIYGNNININECVTKSHSIYCNNKRAQYNNFKGFYYSENGNSLHVTMTENSETVWFNENNFDNVRFQAKNDYGIYLWTEKNDCIDSNFFNNCSVEGSKYAIKGKKIKNTLFNSLRAEEISIIKGSDYKFIELNGNCDEVYFNNIYMYINGFDNKLSDGGNVEFNGKLLKNDGTHMFLKIRFKNNEVTHYDVVDYFKTYRLNILNQTYNFPELTDFSKTRYQNMIVNDSTIVVPDSFFVDGAINKLFIIERFSEYSGLTLKNASGTVTATISNSGTDKTLLYEVYTSGNKFILK